MNHDEMLKKARNRQSYLPEDPTEYNGLDAWKIGEIKDERIYCLVHDGNTAALEHGDFSGEFFFDQTTYDKYVDPSTGKFDAKALSEALQVKPYQDDCNPDKHAEYRNSIACFKVNGNLEAPMAYCEANTQFGGGGAHEVFIPDEDVLKYQKSGTLQFDRDNSLFHTGDNNKIDEKQYNRIDDTSNVRLNDCIDNKRPHPDLTECKKKGYPKLVVESPPK